MKLYLKITLILLITIIFGASLWIYTNRSQPQIADYASLLPTQNTAIFAAYSTDGTVSNYVVHYLKALKEIAPNIIYITDNPIKRSALKKIQPYITHLEAQRHGEYDW